MNAQQSFDRRARRGRAQQRLKLFRLQAALDGAQTIRALGMTRSHIVFEAAGMREEEGFHLAAALRADIEPNRIFILSICGPCL
jgi:PleD family two-component response regulator